MGQTCHYVTSTKLKTIVPIMRTPVNAWAFVIDFNDSKLDWESIRSSPRDGFRDGWVGFDNGALSKIDDVLVEDGGLLHVLPVAVHL